MRKLVLLFLACDLGFAGACSGDQSGVDGGMDATTSDVSTNDSGPDVVSDASSGNCPTYNGSNPVCQAAVQHCNTCNNSQLNACEVANFSSICEKSASVLSQAYLNAVATCEKSTCDNDAANACEQAAVADASLTTEQAKVSADYCAKCSDAGANCARSIVLEFSDTIATELDTLCIPDSGAGCPAFVFCALAVIENAEGKNPCADAGDGG